MLGRAWIRRAPCVPEALLATWRAEAAGWFAGGAPPLEAAPDASHLRRVETPLGSAVAKRTTTAARARRAFDLAEALRAAGLLTPEPLAAWPEEGRHGALLVTRFAPEPTPFAAACACTDDAAREGLARALGAAVARLHAAGFRHRDLKAANLLVRTTPAGPTILFLDLDGLARRLHGSPWARRTRQRDLARLRVSFESRAAHDAGLRPHHFDAVLAGYLSGTDEDPDAWRGGTASWARRHAEHMLATGRPVE